MNHRMTAPPFGPVAPTGAGVMATSDGEAAAGADAAVAVDGEAATPLDGAAGADEPQALNTSATTAETAASLLRFVPPRGCPAFIGPPLMCCPASAVLGAIGPWRVRVPADDQWRAEPSVEARTTSSVASTTRRAAGSLRLMASISRRAISRPISSIGCRTLVSGG